MSSKRKGDATTSPAKKAKADEGPTWQSIHEDLTKGKYIGKYGGCNSAWHALAAVRAGIDMSKYHTKRSPDEFFLKQLDSHVNNPHTQRRWDYITSFDPMGLYGAPPTMSATEACMDVPELIPDLVPCPDGKIVNADGSVNIQKCAIDYVWNLPRFSKRIFQDEDVMRKNLAEYTQNTEVLDKSKNAYLPPLGGCTVYFFGDITKLGDPTTEVAVRVHDSCCGSDVFGTDICTCRPYLVFAINACIDCAKRGGVGVIVYFQKEGRGLGEVTKYRVYNARKAQEGGDCAEKYFYQTESIAGIRDARFQEIMPDVLLWLGITRIDWLLSMSSEKYDAIVAAGIEVMQRVSLPDTFVPRNAHVEINAKICAGYHTDKLDENDLVASLRNLDMVRERCGQIFKLAQEDKLKHFSLDESKMGQVVDYVIKTTKENYPDLNVPYHSRWRHFDQKALTGLTTGWPCDELEKVRREIDLAAISVLLDAGAGDTWRYTDAKGNSTGRSEGLALATFDMFVDGTFSSDVAQPCRVNAHGIKNMTLKQFSKGLQASEHNPLNGAQTRFAMIQRFGDALLAFPEYFGKEICRPGNLVDYVLKHADKDKKVSLRVLWKAIIEGLESIWPKGLAGVKRGDVWVYSPLKQIGKAGSDMIPFHKLSQWLTYSMLEPMQSVGIQFDDLDLLTGLAEYRNGGLFVDFGVLTLRDSTIPADREMDPGCELLVEWRASTICLLDQLAEKVRSELKLTKEQFPLAKLLQGGTWAAGRKIAKEKRSNGAPPIRVRSDGTVF